MMLSQLQHTKMMQGSNTLNVVYVPSQKDMIYYILLIQLCVMYVPKRKYKRNQLPREHLLNYHSVTLAVKRIR